MTQENNRKIRSFVIREGRFTPGQRRAFESYWPLYGLSIDSRKFDADKIFGNDHPVILEIGFGMGHSLLEMAETHPEYNYVGIEVHRPGVATLLRGIHEKKLQNLRVYAEDAVQVLKQCIPDHSLRAVQLYFPDPWHKKRHNKRRLVQSDFVALVAKKLKPEGEFHLATDWEDYAEHMMAVLSVSKDFENAFGHNQFAPKRPEHRPMTKFEKRGERLGHGVWDLIFRKTL